ncbi:extracellular solute-binding protein [Paenibacillus sp. FSL H7-0331]|uniref:extracellular solute-binding protein n=1 Tax=Paenibacillus sp. FSL H7-0331 TaxID=1920421 RepID=UPI00096F6602|nr:extracellular solute-binding protein [Paenibacillus sp. FSL H7-0331]OMF06081.1 hypothetical protein BK127_31580 [Paenibacillus sp. FSL H7-0331]
MKIVKRKKWALSAAVILTVIAMIGCSSETEPPVSGQPLNLSIFAPTYGGALPDTGGQIQMEVEMRSNTKLNITWVPVSDWEKRLNVAIAANNLPDLIVTKTIPGQLFSSTVAQAIENGQLMDLTEYVRADDFAAKYPNLGKYPKEIWDHSEFKGKIYSLPWGVTPRANLSGFIMRKDLFDKSGLKVPITVDELADTLIELSDPPKLYGLQFTGKTLDTSNLKPIAVAYTGVQDWGVDEQGNFMFQAFMPEYKGFLNWVKKLYDARVIEQEFSLGQNASNFSKGNSAMMIHVWWNAAQTSMNHWFAKEAPAEAEVMRIMPVQGPRAYAIAVQPGFNNPVVINTKFDKAKMPQLLKVYDYFASQEFQDFVQYGLEGVHHNVVDGKKVLIPDIPDDGRGQFSSMLNAVYRDFLEEARLAGLSDENYKQMKAVSTFAEETVAKQGPGIPQWNLSSPTFMSKWNAVIKDLDDNRDKVVMGKMSIEEWDKYVQGVTSSETYRQILKEFKEQYAKNRS